MEWISVKDKLPERDEDIFVSAISEDKTKRYYAWWKGYCLLDDIKDGNDDIDYWMPVPKID